MKNLKTFTALVAFMGCLIGVSSASAGSLSDDVQSLYDEQLKDLFVHFHENPELSFKEDKTAKRLGDELEALGYTVHRGIGGTGLIALMENGPGPTVMFRADMDGLPVQEKSGLSYASKAKQVDNNGNEVYVMHACGHDVHVTSLVGTGRLMAERKDLWSGTLMLLGQPAEEIVAGAQAMMEDGLWDRVVKPDFAMAFHVTSALPTGSISAPLSAAYSGADTVDILIKGVGAHGASPHTGVDPIVLGSQIVTALQTVVSRNLPPRRPGVITVGSFHSGTKHNIISDSAKLQITVRSESPEDRQLLLDGIKRVATNMGRVAGLPDEMLPEVIVNEQEGTPPTINDTAFAREIRSGWKEYFGPSIFNDGERLGMGAEDFGFFTTDPYIPSLYFAVGGTPAKAFEEAANGGAPIPSHHSPLFKIEPEGSVTLGVEASVSALLDVMAPR